MDTDIYVLFNSSVLSSITTIQLMAFMVSYASWRKASYLTHHLSLTTTTTICDIVDAIR